MQKTYPSKILLFGEYTVLSGGQALAIPYSRYYGHWANSGTVKKSRDLLDLYEFIQGINSQLNRPVNVAALQALVHKGGYFKSNIPHGVGLGSSAALTAAIYDHFTNQIGLTLEEKKYDLGMIESFFHGKSSGFDALVSLQQNALLIDQDKKIMQIGNIQFTANHIYLLFTGQQRKTSTLVTWFQGRVKNPSFIEAIRQLIRLNDQAITAYLSNQQILEITREISQLQYNFFRNLIIDSLANLWRETLGNRHLTIKFLGAAGGGCYLLFTEQELQQKQFYGFPIQRISSDATP